MGTGTVLIVVFIIILLYYGRSVGSRPKDYPPGPPTFPFIGNLHLMPNKQPHLQFKKWADEYGPIYSLVIGTNTLIVVSSGTIVKDLLDKRSAIYSSRPNLYVGQQLLSRGLRMLLMEYGKTWRMVRGTVHDHLNVKAAKSYVPYQDLENRRMILGFLDEPARWKDHLRRYTFSLTTQMIFGFRCTSIDDPKMHQLFDGFAEFSEVISSPAAALMDAFPFLQYAPAALIPVKKRAMELHEKERDLYVGHWLNVKKAIKNGTANPCLCVDLVNSQNVEGFSDDLAAYISGSLLEAGSDTTYATLLGFVQAMLLFPEVAKRAQEEIDRVCGDRIPMLEDESSMQYIRGCVKESMRWMPTAIMGVPHAVVRDDHYMGYRIPKGAGVMWNVWGIHYDEERFPKPHVFDPLRFADDFQSSAEAASNADASKRDHFLFGAGRRVCQGMHIAERSLLLGIARLLWAFDFEKEKDESGKEITPDAADLTEGMLVQPRTFPVKITPRSERKSEVLREEWRSMEEKLDDKGQWAKIPEGMFFKEYKPL